MFPLFPGSVWLFCATILLIEEVANWLIEFLKGATKLTKIFPAAEQKLF